MAPPLAAHENRPSADCPPDSVAEPDQREDPGEKIGEGTLGRVLDPRALDEGTGARGRVRVEVPTAWLTAGCRIEILAPRRLPCARCDGGGCDACGKSGVLRAPDAEASRRLEITLPGTESTAVALRLADPFGGGLVEQLIVEIHAGTASPCVTRIPDPLPPPDAAPLPVIPWRGLLAAAIATAAAILAAVLAR
ncbi:MAG: hypothetical protein ABI134_07355 [Byssovorax sp.]